MTAKERWKQILGTIDPGVKSLLARDPAEVQGLWHNYGVAQPDVSSTEPSKPYGYFFLELSSLDCAVRSFPTQREMMESLLEVLKGAEECFVMPFIGKPLRMSSNEQRIFMESLTPLQVPYADVYSGIEMESQYEESVFTDASYLVVPIRAPKVAIPPRVVVKNPRKKS